MSKTRGTGTKNQRSPVLSFFKDITMKTLRNIPVMLKILSNKTGALRLSLATNEDDKKNGLTNHRCESDKIAKSKLLAFLPRNYTKIHLFVLWELFALKEKYFLIIFSTFKPLRALFFPDSFGSHTFSSSWVDRLWWLTSSLRPKRVKVISIYAK